MRTLAGLLAGSLAAAAVCAWAQAPAEPEPQEKKAGRRLNLKLDERPSAAPRITFEPRDAGTDKGRLPSLGAAPSRSSEAPIRSLDSSSRSPYPPDTDPSGR